VNFGHVLFSGGKSAKTEKGFAGFSVEIFFRYCYWQIIGDREERENVG